jgi:diguanylate cyclase (GGDEF)-like protein
MVSVAVARNRSETEEMMSVRTYATSQNSRAYEDRHSQDMATVIGCIRTTMLVVGRCAAQIGTPYSMDLEQRLQGLEKRFSFKPSASEIKRIALQADSFIEDSRAKTDDIKSLLLTLADTVQLVGNYDHACTGQLEDLSRSLASAAALDDVSQIKTSLARNIAQIKSSVGQMRRNSQDIVMQLKQQISAYEQKLEFAEAIAFKDQLTGLANRCRIEQQIQWNIQHELTFCIVMFDLNHFKPVNDEFGHSAGDNVLKQFSSNLQAVTRAGDLLGRWGGDEFIAVTMCKESEGRSYIERVNNTVFGKYRVPIENNQFGIDLQVSASIGIAEWSPGETIDQVVAKADANMYENKKSNRRYR